MERVTYLNREVPKDGFRVYIYHKDGEKKLVNSWDEFKQNIMTNEWFATDIEANLCKQLETKVELFTQNELNEADEIQDNLNKESIAIVQIMQKPNAEPKK